MASKAVMASMVLGVGLLVVVLLFTPAMNTVTSDAKANVELDNQTSQNVTERLEITAADINETNSTVTLENLKNFDATTHTLNETEERTFNLSGETLRVNNTAIVTNNTTAQYSVTYPPTFAWNDYAATFFTNLDLFFALLGFTLIMWPLVAIL